MTGLLSLDDLAQDLAGQVVFLRVDFNVPLTGGEVRDATRVEAAVPTIRELSRRGAAVVAASHCGRPQGRRRPEWSLAPVVPVLAAQLERPVTWVEDCIGEPVATALRSASTGDVLLLENVRFHPGETTGDEDFAVALSTGVDVFVGEAFGSAHRDHASVTGVARRVPSKAAGYLMHREVSVLSSVLECPAKPLVLIMGGAKMVGKIETLENLLLISDRVLLGGGIANTFLAAQGYDLGDSLVERERLAKAEEVLATAAERGVEVLLPGDVVVTTDLATSAGRRECAVDAITVDEAAVDLGSRTLERYREALTGAGTIVWNGPLGVFEQPPFDRGTVQVALALAGHPAQRIVGGGETVSAVKQAGVAEELDHVSTGGGAMLQLLAGKKLPGVEVLRWGVTRVTK